MLTLLRWYFAPANQLLRFFSVWMFTFILVGILKLNLAFLLVGFVLGLFMMSLTIVKLTPEEPER
jgi:hypothetical protein